MKLFAKKINFILENLIKFFPILIILGPFAINCFAIIFSLNTILNLHALKRLKTINFKIILIFLSFIIFLFPYNSLDFQNSIVKYASFLRFILMMIGIIIFFEIQNVDKKIFSKIYLNFFIFLIIISVDVFIEFYTGSNLLGYNTDYDGRIASFTNDELIIGYVFSFLSLFTLNFIYQKTNSLMFFTLTLLIVFISFIIGERSNFIKLFFLIFLFYGVYFFILKKFKVKKNLKTILLIIIIIISFFTLSKNTSQSIKFFNTFKNIIVINDQKIDFRFKHEFYETRHAAHYVSALKIFLKYPLFGIGINNFYNESKKSEYVIEGYLSQSTHPHQIYLEILSEVGLAGLLYFIFIFFYPFYLFFKNFKNKINLNLLSHLLLHIFFIFPVFPTGSLFGTNYGLPFWFNLSFLLYFLSKEKINKINY